MQFVRNFASSVSEVYNSINPATLTGAIDVIVVEQEDGSLACSPFHVRFGKYQILRPSQKKVEFKVNNVKQDFSMKLGEGGEAFFVFETAENIPAAMQTSPLVSPVVSPTTMPSEVPPSIQLSEPDLLELTRKVEEDQEGSEDDASNRERKTQSEQGEITPRAQTPGEPALRPMSMVDWNVRRPSLLDELQRPATDDMIPTLHAHRFERASSQPLEDHVNAESADGSQASHPGAQAKSEAVSRAINLSKKFWTENIPTHISDTGDLMLDMTGYKTGGLTEEEALQVEKMARKVLSEELETSDVGQLISLDSQGNIWIYGSEEAKLEADRKATSLSELNPTAMRSTDVVSDPGYHSDDGVSDAGTDIPTNQGHMRHDSDSALGMSSPTAEEASRTAGDPNLNYAKTLRLSSDQLKALDLKPGLNSMTFQVNKATAQAYIYFWRHDVPIVISDIDGTITKSDAMGHMMNAIGRDWTHMGVAKLYTDIVSNGYNIMYLTSRSVGQSDSTRNYLHGIVQDGLRLPKGPVILSPDRTIAALRREVIIRKPEVFKMACLRDIMNLFQSSISANHPTAPGAQAGGAGTSEDSPTQALRTPFYAGFGNRLNDAMSYRSVSIPATRIFTINSNAEVSLYLSTLSRYRTSYNSMQEIVNHYFPPVGMLVKEGGEEYTDFNYWRDRTLAVDEFSASDSGSEADYDDDEEDDEYASRASFDDDDDMPEYLERSYYSEAQGSIASSTRRRRPDPDADADADASSALGDSYYDDLDPLTRPPTQDRFSAPLSRSMLLDEEREALARAERRLGVTQEDDVEIEIDADDEEAANAALDERLRLLELEGAGDAGRDERGPVREVAQAVEKVGKTAGRRDDGLTAGGREGKKKLKEKVRRDSWEGA